MVIINLKNVSSCTLSFTYYIWIFDRLYNLVLNLLIYLYNKANKCDVRLSKIMFIFCERTDIGSDSIVYPFLVTSEIVWAVGLGLVASGLSIYLRQNYL